SLHSGSGILDEPMKLLAVNAPSAIGTSLDSSVSTFLNNTVFSFSGAELPHGYIDLLILRAPGIIADRGLLALLVGTIIITAFRITRSWIPLAYLAFLSFLVFIFGSLPFDGQFFRGDVLFTLFSGGTIAAAFILVSDPATGAKSRPGILIAVLCGAYLTYLFRCTYFEMYGAFFAVALVNSFTPILRFFEKRLLFSPKINARGGLV
ncbi:MAG: RnfABCDGE type electron transport complex subunit D, partial [Treponema sp.]|nr:RnfABCDGE type electron transport complex subunit D [Treponema sp.]